MSTSPENHGERSRGEEKCPTQCVGTGANSMSWPFPVSTVPPVPGKKRETPHRRNPEQKITTNHHVSTPATMNETMNPTRRTLLSLLVALPLMAGGLGTLTGCSSAESTDLNVTVTGLNGQHSSLNQLKGNPSVVTFWATSCPGCIEEMPHLVKLHETFSDRGVTVMGIAMHYDNPDHVRNLVQRRELPYRIVIDESGAAAKSFGNVRLTPTTFVLDAQGRVQYRQIGAFDEKRVAELLSRLSG